MHSDKGFAGARDPFCWLTVVLQSAGTSRREGSGKNRLDGQAVVNRQPLAAGDFQPV